MKEQELILVDGDDVEIGSMLKMEVHEKGVLHRAFSVFIFDSMGRMLLQQRAGTKYHGGLLWTNACCSHPFPGERTQDAAIRRLEQELGFITPLRQIFFFQYRAEVENGLIENEFDHVFAGEYEGEINPDPKEVAAYAYEAMKAIRAGIAHDPSRYTKWFVIAFPRIEVWWKERFRDVVETD